MAKRNIQYTISVQNNSNRITSSSEEKFAGVRHGSLVKIDDEDVLYTVIDRQDFFYIKDFKVESPRIISIDENIGVKLQIGDTLKITYKEYELLMINEIIGGDGYLPNDELTVDSGELLVNMNSGKTCPTLLQVVNVNENNGKISEIKIVDKGKYIKMPQNPCIITGGTGMDLKLNLYYVESDNKTILDRVIEDINFKENKTYLHLNYALPHGITQGNLSVEKSCLVLNTPYIGDTRINVPYSIYRDFTPGLSLPLLAKNSASFETIFNKAMQIIDKEISQLKKKQN